MSARQRLPFGKRAWIDRVVAADRQSSKLNNEAARAAVQRRGRCCPIDDLTGQLPDRLLRELHGGDDQ
jgi:hypothetical protein